MKRKRRRRRRRRRINVWKTGKKEGKMRRGRILGRGGEGGEGDGVGQICTTFLGQGRSVLFLLHSRAEYKIMS